MQTWLWIYWLWALSLTISRKKEEKKVSGWSRYFSTETNKQNDVNFWLIIVPYRKRNKHLHRLIEYFFCKTNVANITHDRDCQIFLPHIGD